jgi:hypothetical protein
MARVVHWEWQKSKVSDWGAQIHRLQGQAASRYASLLVVRDGRPNLAATP